MRAADDRPILVTGGAGFIGCNLADRLAREGHRVIVFDALVRPGVERNLRWLEERHGRRIETLRCDIRDRDTVADVVTDAKAAFHMAAQVAVTTSLVDPRLDFTTNLEGTLNLLEAIRLKSPETPVVFASTNKVYGDLGDIELELVGTAYQPRNAEVWRHGVGESRPLDFHTPYGCSKGAADQYVLDYSRSFGLRTAVLRMSCIYGQRQMGTEDQGWVAHFLMRALAGEPITLYGDGCQVRDILDVGDAVAAYLATWKRIDALKGRTFNIGGGPANAVSLRVLLDYVAAKIGGDLAISHADWRAGDQRYFVADTRAAQAAGVFRQPLDWRTGVSRLLDWLRESRRVPAVAHQATEVVSG